MEAFLSQNGDREVTLALTGGSYNLEHPILMDASEWTGKKRLRLLGGERIKTVFSALSPILTENFVPMDNSPIVVFR